jgi:hypothetical protein
MFLRYASDAFILLNFCINSAPIYLRRAVDNEDVNTYFQLFDKEVDKEILRIAQIDEYLPQVQNNIKYETFVHDQGEWEA